MDATGISTNKLYQATSVHPSTIRQLRQNIFERIDIVKAQALCDHFNISFGELFEYQPQPDTTESDNCQVDDKELIAS